MDTEGLVLYNTIDLIPCTYALSLRNKENQTISKCLYFDPQSNGDTIWDPLYNNGMFPKVPENYKNDNVFGEMGCALASQITLMPESNEDMEFSLVWDMPVVTFPGKIRKYHKFYTNFFPPEHATLKIIDYTFKNYDNWEFEIYNWQKNILNDG